MLPSLHSAFLTFDDRQGLPGDFWILAASEAIMDDDGTGKSRLETLCTILGLAISLIALGFGGYVLILMHITSL